MRVEIADIGEEIYSGLCHTLSAPAAMGEVCILPRHTPFLAKLVPGELRMETDGGERRVYYVSGGYLEVKSSIVTVLADQMLRSQDIDREAALKAREAARQVLNSSQIRSVRDHAKLDLYKAMAQLKVLEHVQMAKFGRHSN